MLTISIPFITAIAFSMLALGLFKFRNHFSIQKEIIFFALATALLSLLVALRWSLNIRLTLFFMPIVASSLPPLAWLCFYPSTRKKIYRHLFGVVFVTLLSLLFPFFKFDPSWLVVLLMLGYGSALMYRSLRADDFTWVKLTQTNEVSTMAIIMGTWLWFIASVNFAVAWDFAIYHGEHASQIVGWSHVVVLIIFAYLAFSVVRLQMPVNEISVKLPPPTEHVIKTSNANKNSENQAIIDQLTTWLVEESGYQDPNLNLDKMARKLSIPSRQISIAINQVTKQGISQWVNTIRIEQAKTQLKETDKTVIDIMLDCGYFTKSNFNKEFKRQTGMNPSEYRRAMRSI